MISSLVSFISILPEFTKQTTNNGKIKLNKTAIRRRTTTTKETT